jgi:hypothetical protein
MITLDLRMDAGFIKENMQIKWISETGIVENVQKVIKEYKLSRNLIVNQITCFITNSCFKVISFKLKSRSKFAFLAHQVLANQQ